MIAFFSIVRRGSAGGYGAERRVGSVRRVGVVVVRGVNVMRLGITLVGIVRGVVWGGIIGRRSVVLMRRSTTPTAASMVVLMSVRSATAASITRMIAVTVISMLALISMSTDSGVARYVDGRLQMVPVHGIIVFFFAIEGN